MKARFFRAFFVGMMRYQHLAVSYQFSAFSFLLRASSHEVRAAFLTCAFQHFRYQFSEMSNQWSCEKTIEVRLPLSSSKSQEDVFNF